MRDTPVVRLVMLAAGFAAVLLAAGTLAWNAANGITLRDALVTIERTGVSSGIR